MKGFLPIPLKIITELGWNVDGQRSPMAGDDAPLGV